DLSRRHRRPHSAVHAHAGHVRDEEQLRRVQRARDGRGGLVRVDVEGEAALRGGRHRRDDGRQTGEQAAVERRHAHGDGLADLPQHLERVGACGEPLGTIELVATELDDPDAQHASPAVSGRPTITFMFWIACPAAPLMRLSIAAITVSRGRRTLATGTTPIATRLRYTTSLRDGSVPRVSTTQGSP